MNFFSAISPMMRNVQQAGQAQPGPGKPFLAAPQAGSGSVMPSYNANSGGGLLQMMMRKAAGQAPTQPMQQPMAGGPLAMMIQRAMQARQMQQPMGMQQQPMGSMYDRVGQMARQQMQMQQPMAGAGKMMPGARPPGPVTAPPQMPARGGFNALNANYGPMSRFYGNY